MAIDLPRFGAGFQSMQQNDQLEDQHRENSGRLAQAHAVYLTSGTGESVSGDPILFTQPFIGRPQVQYGYTIEAFPNFEYWQSPRCTGGVGMWITERNAIGSTSGSQLESLTYQAEMAEAGKRGLGSEFYIGFFPAVTITVPPLPVVEGTTYAELRKYRAILRDNQPETDIAHNFTFKGESFKLLPQSIDEQVNYYF